MNSIQLPFRITSSLAALGMLACAGGPRPAVGGPSPLTDTGGAPPVAPSHAVRASMGRTVAPTLGRLTEEELQALGRPYQMVEGEPMITLLPADGIPALDLPDFVDAEAARAFMSPEETLLGVVGKDGTAKCYSAWQLDAHEIVNDLLDGEPISATW